MTHGTMAVDYEVRVDYERLRRERLAKAKAALEASGYGALVCFDPNNTRYITSTYLGEWARDKMGRYSVLPLGGEPILYDFGSAVKVKQMRSPWLKQENVRPTSNWMRGSVPLSAGIMDDFAQEFAKVLDEHGVRNKPIGVDMMDVPLLKAMQSVGIQIEDGQQVMLDARIIKTVDEVELLKLSAGMADAAFADLFSAIRPGVRENELAAIASDRLFRLGSDQVEYVNVASGERTNPHPHTSTDRMIRPGRPGLHRPDALLQRLPHVLLSDLHVRRADCGAPACLQADDRLARRRHRAGQAGGDHCGHRGGLACGRRAGLHR